MIFIKLFSVVIGKMADLDKKKLNHFIANAFTVRTISNNNATEKLLDKYKFKYVLPSVFSQDPLKRKFLASKAVLW